MKGVFVFLSSLVIAACATTPSDYDEGTHEMAANIEMFEQGQPLEREYEVLGFVRSNSCGSKTASRFTGDWDEAKLLLRLEAALLEADAIVEYKCWTNPVDMVSNCWASKRCEGNAVKYADQ